MSEAGDLLMNKSMDFAVRIVNLYKWLCSEQKEYIMIEFHDVSCTRLVIVSQYTSVGIFAFPNVKVSIYSPLSLYAASRT